MDIWPLSFKFNFGLIGRPLQPPTDRVPKINKKVDFWWSNPHWETRIGHFGARVDENIKLRKFFDKMRLLRSLRALRLLRLLRSLRRLRFLNAREITQYVKCKQFVIFWGQIGCWGHWGQWCYHVCWGHWGYWGFQNHLGPWN